MDTVLNNMTRVIYCVALYIRLSKEDGDREESESVTNQRKILREYAKDNNYQVYDEYVDEGYTGTNFNRPAFKRLLADIQAGKVNMVITKDLSRLGRDYIETGRYIESFFPENQVRYIAVLDDVDTFLDKNCDTVAFKNIMNDYYAKTTSKNIKKTKNRKKKEGFYYTAYAPFGYRKVSKSGELEIDETQAKLVRRIFELFIGGKGTYQIANLLTDEGIVPPGLQKNMACFTNHMTQTTDKWNHNSIKRMLTNEIYIGNCIQNKTKKISYKSKKMIALPPEEQTIIKNHHKPIITKEIWDLTQNLMKNAKNTKKRETDVLLKGLLYCLHCNNKLSIRTKAENTKKGQILRRYISCGTANKKYSNKKCFHQYINYDYFEEKILEKVTEVLSIYINSEEFHSEDVLKKILESQGNKASIEKKIHSLEEELVKISGKIKMLYTDKLNGLLEAQDYEAFYEGLLAERRRTEEILKETKAELAKYDDADLEVKIQENMKKVIKKIVEGQELSKEVINQLVNKIEVDKDKNVTIYFNFYELDCIGGMLNVNPNI